ncbi:uncharacterized protein LOC142035983 isoform X2 [Buteo buteo]|uniref:uncharacterized protein LOC142035983 isoform X2 n=1 Tax=Buteo buteo TaxID=30397 RepID=UPI003EBC0238
MGQQLTKEKETILSTWKALLKRKGLKTPEHSLQRIFIWCKMQGFQATTVTAFSVGVWQSVALKMFGEISKGQKELCELAVVWRLLTETLKEWKAECDANDRQKKAEKSDNVSNEKVSAQVTAAATAAISAVAGRKRLTGRIGSYPYSPPPPPTPLITLPGDEGPSSPTGAAAEGVTPSAPPEENNVAINAEPESVGRTEIEGRKDGESHTECEGRTESESRNETEAEKSLIDAMRSLQLADKTIPKEPLLWTLPPSTITVVPRSPDQFWEGVRKYAADSGNWDLVERLSLCSLTPAFLKPLGKAAEAPVTFPVFKAAPGTNQHNEHNPISWRVVQDLQNRVQEYGINSPEVLQLIRILGTALLCPYDIMHLAQVLFQPVQLHVFQSTWRQMARTAAQHNLRLLWGDPRLGLGEDALLGAGQYSSPQLQATWPPMALEQAQNIGLMAIKRAMDMAAPKQKYATIRQGPTGPFLQFVEGISAALEKQVEDEVLRQILCKQLARDNANEDCQKIIQALPGDPSVPDMVAACSKAGTLEHTVTTIANAMRNSGKCCGCGSEGHINVTSPHKTSPGQICAMVSTPYPPVTIPKGTHIAQLVPFSSSISRAEQHLRCDGGFSSMGPPQFCWSQTVSSSQPHVTCTLSNHGRSLATVRLAGLLDTGADVTITADCLWPSTWPTEEAELWKSIQLRTEPYFIMHIRSHTTLPGFYTEAFCKGPCRGQPGQYL